MRVKRLLMLSTVLSSAVVASIAAAAPLAPPAGAVSGEYIFTYRTTNVKLKPSMFNVRVARCAAPCSAFTTVSHATGKPDGVPRLWKWNGKQYIQNTTLRGKSQCVGRGKKVIAGGYDIVSRYALMPGRAQAGRVVTFRGAGSDKYLPNDKGLKAGCPFGAYDYAITAVAA